MDDFTKEELNFIHALIHDFLIGREDHIAESLWMKIKYMIDNYCEHEFIGYLEGSAAVPYCNKCCKAVL